MATWQEIEDCNRSLIDDLKTNAVDLNAIWLQSECKCDYCGIDLLETHEAYRDRVREALTPKRKKQDEDMRKIVSVLQEYDLRLRA